MTDTAPQPFASSSQNEGDTNEAMRAFLRDAIKRVEIYELRKKIDKNFRNFK